MNKNCIVCNGTYTTKQVFDAWLLKMDRQLCQKHIDEVCELILHMNNGIE